MSVDNADGYGDVPAPETLTEMQALDYDDYRRIGRYRHRADVWPSKRKVIRHLIELADKELSWRGEQNANSLRDFWYSPTKPILETAFPDFGSGVGTSGWNTRMNKELSSVLSDMVQDDRHDVTYRGLNILDGSRERELRTTGVDSDKLLFVEKNAAFRKLKPLAKTYNVTVVEGSGWQSTAMIEDLAANLTPGTAYTFYLLSDYDPTGFGIVDDFLDRAESLGVTVNRAESRRIGILPSQVDTATRKSQRFTPAVSSDSDREWLAAHGIEGTYGLELEAVGGSVTGKGEALRALVVDEIGDEIRVDDHRVRAVERKTGASGQSAASDVVRSITGDLERVLYEAAADVLDEAEGVENARYNGFGVSVTVDRQRALAAADGETDEPLPADWLPVAYDEDAIHEAAKAGRGPSVSGGNTAREHIREELERRIATGEVDVLAALNLRGDDSDDSDDSDSDDEDRSEL